MMLLKTMETLPILVPSTLPIVTPLFRNLLGTQRSPSLPILMRRLLFLRRRLVTGNGGKHYYVGETYEWKICWITQDQQPHIWFWKAVSEVWIFVIRIETVKENENLQNSCQVIQVSILQSRKYKFYVPFFFFLRWLLSYLGSGWLATEVLIVLLWF